METAGARAFPPRARCAVIKLSLTMGLAREGGSEQVSGVICGLFRFVFWMRWLGFKSWVGFGLYFGETGLPLVDY